MPSQESPISAVLVIETDESSLRLIGHMLEGTVVTVHLADRLHEGLRMIETHMPDVVLLGIEGAGDFKLCAWMKDRRKLIGIPLILFGGGYGTLSQETLEQCGAAGFLPKPFKRQQLVDAIQGVIRLRSRARPNRH